jgi:hypothetical protein
VAGDLEALPAFSMPSEMVAPAWSAPPLKVIERLFPRPEAGILSVLHIPTYLVPHSPACMQHMHQGLPSPSLLLHSMP